MKKRMVNKAGNDWMVVILNTNKQYALTDRSAYLLTKLGNRITFDNGNWRGRGKKKKRKKNCNGKQNNRISERIRYQG